LVELNLIQEVNWEEIFEHKMENQMQSFFQHLGCKIHFIVEWTSNIRLLFLVELKNSQIIHIKAQIEKKTKVRLNWAMAQVH
jgi:hypothetical protein